jgi:uncharacterized radical SAM superfamily Fe-S cluster-containing enzyme
MTMQVEGERAVAEPAVGSGERELGTTESVCPDCLARIPGTRIVRGADVLLRKRCPAHGTTETVIWRDGDGATAWKDWRRVANPGRPLHAATPVGLGCPFDCGLCPDHRQQACCVLLEVTQRCDLHCAFCFADAGASGAPGAGAWPPGAAGAPPLAVLRERLRGLFAQAGPVNLQLSGGEPCVRDDLPEIAAAAREIGFAFVQVNTNGLRLARDPGFASRLHDAGVATAFLQFDGTRDETHVALRGRPLAAHKAMAIDACAAAGIGVVLVPVVVPGVNDDDLGEILRFALAHQPAVRGIHFQPVSYFGRYPAAPENADRITLPEIVAGLAAQSGGLVRVEDFQPAGAENARCSFNGTFVAMPDGRLLPLTRWSAATGPAGASCCAPAPDAPEHADSAEPTCCSPAPTLLAGNSTVRARDAVARNWAASHVPIDGEPADDLGVFLARAQTHRLAISGMAFQDAWTLDLERLRDCHISILATDGRLVPFCAYNLTARDGRGPYRGATMTPEPLVPVVVDGRALPAFPLAPGVSAARSAPGVRPTSAASGGCCAGNAGCG